MQKGVIVLFAWWFFFTAHQIAGVAGPFSSEMGCEKIRIMFSQKAQNKAFFSISECITDEFK